MFWGLASGSVDTRGHEFEHVLRDIQTLNDWALEGRLEVTAISLHAYPFLQDRYVILPHGASMGRGYGPIVVARDRIDPERLRDLEIAVPGRMTTAFLALKLYLGGEFRFRSGSTSRGAISARRSSTRSPKSWRSRSRLGSPRALRRSRTPDGSAGVSTKI